MLQSSNISKEEVLQRPEEVLQVMEISEPLSILILTIKQGIGVPQQRFEAKNKDGRYEPTYLSFERRDSS